PPQLVAQSVHERLPQIGLESPFTPRFETLDPLERLEDRFLDQIRGVRDIAGPSRQASRRPPAQDRDLTGKQQVERGAIAVAGTCQQCDRFVFIAASWSGFTGHLANW